MMNSRYALAPILALVCLAPDLRGQAQQLSCVADDPWDLFRGVNWFDIDGNGDFKPPAPDTVTSRLHGLFEVFEVTTEGTPQPVVTLWFLRTVPAPQRCGTGCADSTRRTGVLGRKLSTPTAPFDSATVAGAPAFGPDAIRFAFDPRTDRLSMSLGFASNEGDQVGYTVTQVDPYGFQGRWAEGGIGAPIFKRGPYQVMERVSGYFCARRLPPP